MVGGTVLGYDTAWSPNNGTLQRLHEKTGWTITNEYMEEGMQMHGRFTCENNECEDEELEYLTHCEICEEGKADHEFDEEQDGLICDDCRRKALPRRCNPRPQLFTDMQYASMIKNGIAARTGGDSGVYPVVKLFTPDAAASWLLSEASRDDPNIAFGLCDLGL